MTEKKDNVVKFKSKKTDLPTTESEASDRILEVRKGFITQVTGNLVHHITTDLVNYGFDIKLEDSHLKDLVMLAEVLNAVMLRYIGAEHFLHEVVDNVIDINSDTGLTDMITDMVKEEEVEE